VTSPGIFILGAVAQGVYPVGSSGEAPVGGLGRSPPEADTVCRHCLQIFDSRNNQHIGISHHSPPGSWPVCFTLGL